MRDARTNKGKNVWFLDNGCSRHMMGDRSMFLSIAEKDGGTMTFGGNDKGKIIGVGKIGKNHQTSLTICFWLMV